MTAVLWIVAAVVTLVVAVFLAALVAYVMDERSKHRTAEADAAARRENGTVRAALVRLHRPEVWERHVEGDGQHVTALCTHCTKLAGAPVLFPCETVEIVREASWAGRQEERS